MRHVWLAGTDSLREEMLDRAAELDGTRQVTMSVWSLEPSDQLRQAVEQVDCFVAFDGYSGSHSVGGRPRRLWPFELAVAFVTVPSVVLLGEPAQGLEQFPFVQWFPGWSAWRRERFRGA